MRVGSKSFVEADDGKEALMERTSTVGGQRAGTIERRNTKMICVAVETREGALTRRARITAPSIERALRIARGGKPGCEARLVFPIDPEAFFVPEGSGQKEAA